MTNRSAGPEFRQQIRPIKDCSACQGKGKVQGLFYEMVCDDCLAGGFVDGTTGEALTTEEIILQLRLRLNEATDQIRFMRQTLADYERPGRGPGGAVYTGD
ncbi:hypothetical protein [Marinobacter sp. BGYM27]|uniref:hypothetical protein n=1 Tax=Marinobacter sp. BGYM27 TaxID=2975597 RepID=UPI0021A5E3FD|nr:hypothetical protein [Marinobacter sp. BGYM27]MDG5498948.1 hypothetical protein [Marinobacter sp. BGYM27]